VVDGAQERRDRRTARVVAWCTLGVIGLGAAAEAEAEVWPVTAFRLFSTVRTADGATTSLVVLDADGARTTVPVGSHPSEVLATTSHQLVDLRHLPAHVARDKVVAWLQLAGLDPADFRSAVVERTSWTMDPGTRTRSEHGTTVLAEVTL